MARIDYERAAPAYDAARGMSLDAIGPWREALAPHFPPASGKPVLDLGSGTGQFSTALAGWFDVRVVGVEPAAAMRDVAAHKSSDPRVRYVGGDGEHLPLRERVCGAAWLSTVIHHLRDIGACARELRRVLDPSARILIRSSFPGRHERITLFRFFPAASRVANTFPSLGDVERAFAAVGFEPESLASVSQISAPSLAEFRDRVRLRADSTLKPLTDEEFNAGLAAIERAIAAEPSASPVVDQLDLFVLRPV